MSAPVDISMLLDDEALFQLIASVKKFPAKECTRCCTMCSKQEKDIGRPIQRCSKCHGAFYCSKECQTLDWSGHKEICGAPGTTKRLHKLATNLVLCPTLLIQLQSCCMLAFDLLKLG
ncbi:MSS51-like protein, mitochondrial [Mycena sanguinolenta]|uniref:MSS51-like protein, mitochondrial n=1 Tax=Mycena sanguinolenta TaxID=230812 RepID=A0A8H7CHG6_9AGAR|nr:MSS51-like protein, mitochondrial [Mycena sanguinolenta]